MCLLDWWGGHNFLSICILWWWSNLVNLCMSYWWRCNWWWLNFNRVLILKSRGWWKMIIHGWWWCNRHRRSWCPRIPRASRSRCWLWFLHSCLTILSLLLFKLVCSGLSTFSVSKVCNNCQICSSCWLLNLYRCLILGLLSFFLLDFLFPLLSFLILLLVKGLMSCSLMMLLCRWSMLPLLLVILLLLL